MTTTALHAKTSQCEQVPGKDNELSTKKEYNVATVPVGEALTGQSTDFLGRLSSDNRQLGADEQLPLFNEQASMDDREQIQEPLFTGIKVHYTLDNRDTLKGGFYRKGDISLKPRMTFC